MLETDVADWNESNLSKAAVHNLTFLQNCDVFEDAKDLSFTPFSVIDHKVTNVTVGTPSDDAKCPFNLKTVCQVGSKVIQKTEEVSWTNACTHSN